MEEGSVFSEDERKLDSVLSEDELMKDYVLSLGYDDLIKSDDETIARYLQTMIDCGKPWPVEFVQDANVFNKYPRDVFDSKKPILLFLNPKPESCGRTDGCESGCWRIIGGDKLIKSEETGKILGFKKILKFWDKKKPKEYKRNWVMEEYRVVRKRNQDRVFCKIRLLFQTQISFLLDTHFSHLYYTSPPFFKPSKQVDTLNDPTVDVAFLKMLINWPTYIPLYFLDPNEVYCVAPWELIVGLDLEKRTFKDVDSYFFVQRTEICGRRDGCERGCWRIIGRDRVIKSEETETGKVLGIKRILKFIEKEKTDKFVYKSTEGDEVLVWTMEEYRLAKKKKQDKVICRIRLQFSEELNWFR